MLFESAAANFLNETGKKVYNAEKKLLSAGFVCANASGSATLLSQNRQTAYWRTLFFSIEPIPCIHGRRHQNTSNLASAALSLFGCVSWPDRLNQDWRLNIPF
jgi:hypothetical protein